MPYLPEEDKENLKDVVDPLIDRLNKLSIDKLAGAINYINYTITLRWTKVNGKRYYFFAVLVGTLLCCILEIYRRIVAPYEDEKIEENGDVY